MAVSSWLGEFPLPTLYIKRFKHWTRQWQGIFCWDHWMLYGVAKINRSKVCHQPKFLLALDNSIYECIQPIKSTEQHISQTLKKKVVVDRRLRYNLSPILKSKDLNSNSCCLKPVRRLMMFCLMTFNDVFRHGPNLQRRVVCTFIFRFC
jgi:hypothetical protein